MIFTTILKVPIMIVGNFFNIKSTNGLFYYGLDYLKQNLDLVRLVLVRPALEKKIRDALPNVNVIVCTTNRYLLEALLAGWRRDLIFTPTSHPLPGLNNQWVVLHDAYPFEVGHLSSLKRFLLRYSLSLSRCKVGYINRSDAKPFVASLGVKADRMIFSPNQFPKPAHRLTPISSHSSGPTTVGLLGTDSAKKNYDRLFNSVRRAGLSNDLVFLIYGHETSYFNAIRSQFSELRIQLIRSDEAALDDFMGRVNVLTSVAEQEGFGRPIAAALLAGMPVELLERPVFREFFSGGARFHSSVDMLVQSLPRGGNEGQLIHFTPPTEVVAAFIAANAEIRRTGSITVN